MRLAILTMSRGDEPRLAEWVTYHSRLGFNDFRVILDNPIDNSETLLKNLEVDAEIRVDVRGANGVYFDGLNPSEQWQLTLSWREENAARIEAAGMRPNINPVSFRQREYFVPKLEEFAAAGEGWLSILDVDEFFVLPAGQSMLDVVTAASKPRVRFLSYNIDMSAWTPGQSVLEHTMRWHADDLAAYGKGWDTRVKSIARHDALLPMDSLHRISPGPHQVMDPEVARLLHYRGIDQGIPELPYRVFDDAALRRYLKYV